MSRRFNLFSLMVFVTVAAIIAGVTRGTGLHPFLVLSAVLFVTGPWTALLVCTLVRIWQPNSERQWFWTTLLIVLVVAVSWSLISGWIQRPYSLPLSLIIMGIGLFWPPLTMLYYVMRPLFELDGVQENDTTARPYWTPVMLSVTGCVISVYVLLQYDPISAVVFLMENQKPNVDKRREEQAADRRRESERRSKAAHRSLTRLLAGKVNYPDSTFSVRTDERFSNITLEGSNVNDFHLSRLHKVAPGVGSLKLIGTSVTDDGLKHLQFCGYLRRIKIQNSPLTNQGLLNLDRCSLYHLSQVDFENTGVTDTAVRELQVLLHLRQLSHNRTGPVNFMVGPILDYRDLRARAAETGEKGNGLPGNYEPNGLSPLCVNLVGPGVTDDLLAHVPKECDVLRLEQTGVTIDGLMHLMKLRRLKVLILEDNDRLDRENVGFRTLRKHPSIDLIIYYKIQEDGSRVTTGSAQCNRTIAAYESE